MRSKPTNTKPSGCVTVPAPCVIWDGPELPGLNICKGDSITLPIYQLAKKLCTVQGYLSLGTYDLSSLDLSDCEISSFVGMIQYCIEQIALLKTQTTGVSVTESSLDIEYTVPDCFIPNGPVQGIVDYVANIGNKVCGLVSEVSILTQTIQQQQLKITDLEEQIVTLTS